MPDRVKGTFRKLCFEKAEAGFVIVHVHFLEDEMRRRKGVGQIRSPAQNHIINPNDGLSERQKAIRQMAPDKPGDPGNKAFRLIHC